MFRNRETFDRMYGGTKMNEDWGKAIVQLCVIIQNDAYLKDAVLQYVEIMKSVYRIDSEDFEVIYSEWERSGEIVDKRRKNTFAETENVEKSLYPKSMDGLCRLFDEGILEEETFCAILEEESCEIQKRNDGKIIGFYPQYPGCIGCAGDVKELEKVMRKSLKNWIRAAYILWKENKILVK